MQGMREIRKSLVSYKNGRNYVSKNTFDVFVPNGTEQ